MADSLQVKLGADTSEFRGELAAAANASNAAFARMNAAGANAAGSGGLGGFVRSIHHDMRILHQFLVAGGLATLAHELFSKGAEYARNYKGAIDESVEAMKRLEAATGGANIAGRVMVGLAGLMEKFGLALGSIVYGTDAASDALNNMAEESRKAFDAEKVKKYNEAIEELQRHQRDHAFAEGTNEQKMGILLVERVNLKNQLAHLDAQDAEAVKVQTKLEDNLYQINKLETKEIEKQVKAEVVKAQIVDVVKKKYVELTDEMRKQQAIREAGDDASARSNLLTEDTIILGDTAYGPAHSAQSLEGASDAALRSLISRDRAAIRGVIRNTGTGATAGADAATGFLPQGIVTARLQTDIQRAQWQLSNRSAKKDPADALDFIGKGIDDINKRLHSAGFMTNGQRQGGF